MRGCFLFLILWFLCPPPLVATPPGYFKPATHPTKPGAYIVGHWEYLYSILAAETRSEGREGKLLYRGCSLTAPAGTIVKTPVGIFYFSPFASPNVAKIWLADGWLQTGCYNAPIFKEDGAPAGSPSKAKAIDGLTLLKMNGVTPTE